MRDAHAQQLATGFADFTCRCSIARGFAAVSCLDQFNKAELRQIHQQTYGIQDAAHMQTASVARRVHTRIWALARKRDTGNDAVGRSHTVPEWTLSGKRVCQAAFIKAVGGSRFMHRIRLSFVLGGHSGGSGQAPMSRFQKSRFLAPATRPRRAPESLRLPSAIAT